MKAHQLSAIAASILLAAACGGGGGATSKSTTSTGNANTPSGTTAPTTPPVPDPSNVKGLVFDGPVSSAKVICDTNHNGALDVGETTTQTTSSGQFNMACPVGTQLVVLGDGIAQDTLTKQPMRGVLYGLVTEATQGYTQLNALTTLAVSMINNGASVSDAENQLRKVFGIPSTVSLYGHHPASNAALMNAVLSTQTTLLSAAGDFAFVNRAVGASDNKSINAIHSELSTQFGIRLGVLAGATPWTTLQDSLKHAIESSAENLSTSPSMNDGLRKILTNQAARSRVVLNSFLAGKIASDTYSQNVIQDLQLQGLDLTKPLPASINTFIKNSATWSTRFDPQVGDHYDTAKLPLESSYLNSMGGFIKLDNGAYMDPMLKDDGRYAFAAEVTDYNAATNSLTFMLNPSKDDLGLGLTEEIQFDPFTNPSAGFTLVVFKAYSSPDELLKTSKVYGNCTKPLVIPGTQVQVITKDGAPTVAVGVNLSLGKVALNKGDRIVVMWNDATPQDQHSFVLINSGQRGRGISQMMSQTYEVGAQ